MKTNPYYRSYILLILCIFGTVANGQFRSDSLMEYLSIAAKNNPAVQQKFAEYQSALQRVPQIGSLPDPELSLGVYISPMMVANGKQIANIQLMQMFPWFGTLRYAKDEMSLMAMAQYEVFEDAKLQLFYDVELTWYELYSVEQSIRIYQKNIDILHTLERLSMAKLSTSSTEGNSSSSANMSGTGLSSGGSVSGSSMGNMGGGSSSGTSQTSTRPQNSMSQSSMTKPMNESGLADVYAIRIEIAELDNSIATMQSQRTTTTARFNSLLNRPMETPVAVDDTIAKDSLPIDLQVMQDSILSSNPMLNMIQYEQQSLDARKQMVSRMGYPMVGLGLSYSVIGKDAMSSSSMNGRDMIMPMVTVTLPIYRKKYRAMQDEAEMLKTGAGFSYSSAYNMLQTEYYSAVQQLQDAERRIQLYESQSQLAQQSLSLKIKSFSVSSADLTDVLRVRQQVLDYELKHIEAIVQYNTAVAQFRLLFARTNIQ